MSEPTGNVIESGGIYITLGMDEDADDIIGVSVHGRGIGTITILGLLTLAREAILDGNYTLVDETQEEE